MTTMQETPAPPAPTDRPGPSRRTRRLAAVALTAVVVTTAGGAALAMRGGDDLPAPSVASALTPNAPITLPGKVLGLAPVDASKDATQVPAWKAKARTAGRGGTVTGRTYGDSTPGGRTVRVVVGRTDLTGQLEQAWAASPGDVVGEARCTNNTRLVKEGQARVRPTLMLCWRTSGALSAYALIIDPKVKTPVPAQDAAAALDAAWKAAGQG